MKKLINIKEPAKPEPNQQEKVGLVEKKKEPTNDAPKSTQIQPKSTDP